jgi:hypothetical protein
MFFKSAGLQQYFTVLYSENENDDRQEVDRDNTLLAVSTIDVTTISIIDNIDILAIITDWKEQDEKLNEELEVADAETTKTDHTLWFKKTG